MNRDKLKQIIEKYKENFLSHQWEKEKYKWEAVKHFRDNWDIDAENFGEMFKEATNKTYNLLASQNKYPRRMINKFAKADEETTRSMFMNLYDESEDIFKRIENFNSNAELLLDKYGKDKWKSHFQDLNTISTYLWLRYPEKYYIYKYSVYKDVVKELESKKVVKKGLSYESYSDFFILYNQICEELKTDGELVRLLTSVIGENQYEDPNLKILTIDFAYFLSRRYPEMINGKLDLKERVSETSDELNKTNYWWLNANPSIWGYSNIKIDEVVDYTIYNEDGNKRRIHQNFLDAKKGDIFIGYETSPTKKVVAIGRIEENDGDKIYFKKTEDLKTFIEYDRLKEYPELEDMEFFKSLHGSLFKLTKDEYKLILNIIREENPNYDKSYYKPYSKEDFLNEVFISEESYDTVKALLNRKKNIILQGPPGVGKTFIAKRLAYSIIGKEDETKIEMIQFHQSYSYEDFIMGYRPSGNGFELKEGPFYKFCKEAEEDLENDYYFIIDEINRGNLSKIFGELMMLVENNKRGEEISLTYSDESFSVPENVYIIGMMNTADRSLAIIDYALRRRFSFFDIEPTFESDGFKNLLIGKGMDEALIQTIKTRINYINSEIENDVNLGKGFKIGHSYFCDYDKREDWYEEVIKYEIAPLIREYWFDEEDKAKSYIEGLLR